MANKPNSLNVSAIVLGADADTIRKALEARESIDRLLAEREKAYALIAELENQIESVIEDSIEFPYPEPPEPVFGYNPTASKGKTKPKKAATKSVAPTGSSPSAPAQASNLASEHSVAQKDSEPA